MGTGAGGNPREGYLLRQTDLRRKEPAQGRTRSAKGDSNRTIPVEGQSPKDMPERRNMPPQELQTAASEEKSGMSGLSALFRKGKDAGRKTEKEGGKGVSTRQKSVSVEPEKKKSDKKTLFTKKIDLKSLDEQELKVYNTMKPNVPMSADELVRDDQSIATVMAARSMLEMIGAVEAGKGGYFMRTDPDDAPGRLVEDDEIE